MILKYNYSAADDEKQKYSAADMISKHEYSTANNYDKHKYSAADMIL